MAITLGGGSNAAGFAAFQLESNQNLLEKSLARLSSGKRILSAADDPGNLAVSMKLQSAINVAQAVGTNVSNALSFSETQDGSLATAGDVLTRVSELRTAYDNPIATTEQKGSYETEFQQLRATLNDLMSSKFNDISLFSSTDAGGMTVYTSPSGSSGVGIDMGKLNLPDALRAASTEAFYGTTNASGTASLADFSASDIDAAISGVATLRAESGAISSRLTFSQERLSSSQSELETAYGRIMDVDIASELVDYTNYSVQVYAASAMLVQANLNMTIVSDLLMASMRK
jgi:flagellin